MPLSKKWILLFIECKILEQQIIGDIFSFFLIFASSLFSLYNDINLLIAKMAHLYKNVSKIIDYIYSLFPQTITIK